MKGEQAQDLEIRMKRQRRICDDTLDKLNISRNEMRVFAEEFIVKPKKDPLLLAVEGE
jgi:hypothetical protein